MFTEKPYGAFGSVEDFDKAIKERRKTGVTLLGSGEIFLGAKFKNRWELENPYGYYPRLAVNVYPDGTMQIISDKPIAGLGPWEILD